MKHDDKKFSLYQRRGEPNWYLRYKLGSKWRDHRINSKYRSRREAERYAAEFVAAIARGDRHVPTVVAAPSPDSATLNDLAPWWLALRKQMVAQADLAPATAAGDRSALDRHILPELGSVPLAQLGTALLREFVRKLRATGKVVRVKTKQRDEKGEERTKVEIRREPMANFTVRNVVASLTQFIEDAMADGKVHLPANPARHPHVRAVVPAAESKAGRNVVIHLTTEQAEKLVACEMVPEHRRLRYLVGLLVGLRDGEIAGLIWEDIDLAAEIPTIRIIKALALVGPEGFASMQKPKTDDGVRTLPLHALASRALRAWKAKGWADYVGRSPKSTDPVFPTEAGGACRPKSAKFLRADLVRAGCSSTYADHDIDFHALRRTFATWLAENDVSESLIKRMMGHRASGVTNAHYTAKTLHAMRKAIDTIGLSVAMGQVVTLPLQAVVNDEHRSADADAFAESANEAPQQTSDDSPVIPLAPPARIGRATFGLGNRCSIH